MSSDSPDVRVRLSAEGTAEVVAALRQVQREAAIAGQKSVTGFLNIKNLLGSFKQLVGGFTVVAIANQLKELVVNGAAFADQEHDTALAIGTTVANLGAFNVAANRTGDTLDKAAPKAAKFAQRLEELKAGLPEAVALFGALGLKAENFPSNDTIENLAVFGKRLSELKDGESKTATLTKLLSTRYVELLPIIEELGQRGLPALRKEAEATGQSLSTRVQARAGELQASFARLGRQTQVMGATLASELGPDLERTGALLGETFSGETGEALGRLIALVLKLANFALPPVLIVLELIAFSINGLLDGLVTVSRAAALAVTGHWKQAGEVINANVEKQLQRSNALLGRIRREVDLGAGGDPPLAPGRLAAPPEKTGEVNLRDALRRGLKDRQALLDASLDAELAIFKLKAKLRTEADQREFDAGLLAVREFFARRRAAVQDEADKEIGLLQRRRASAVDQADTPEAAKAATTKIDSQITTTRLEAEGRIAQLTFDERQEIVKLGADRFAIEAELKGLQGDTHLAAMASIAEEAAARRKTLIQAGVAPAVADQKVNQFTELRLARTEFEETQRRAELAIQTLQTRERDIQTSVTSGQSNVIQGESATLQLRRNSLTVLTEIAEKLRTTAASIEGSQGGPLTQSANDFTAQVREIGAVTDVAGQRLNELRTNLQNGVGEAFSQFLGRDIDTVEGLEGALRSLALTVLDTVQQIAGAFLGQAISGGLSGLFGFKAPGLKDGGPVHLADGGPVRGPGGPRADRVPAWLSNREYVVNARSTGRPGAETLLHGLNTEAPWALRLAAALSSGRTEGIELLAEAHRADRRRPAARRFAAGGPVRGPGGPRADRIPAWLSNREYVVNAATTGRPGVETLLHGLNTEAPWALRVAALVRHTSRVPVVRAVGPLRLASGGLVGGSTAARTGSAGDLQGQIAVNVGLAPGLTATAHARLDTPDGIKMLLRIVQQNPGAFSAALGRRR